MLFGVTSGIIAFLLIFTIFWKCELFKKVRFYDQQKQKLIENREKQETEEKEEDVKKLVDVYGEVINLRS